MMMRGTKLDPSVVRDYFNLKLSKIRWRADQGIALCPLHDDHQPSLSVDANKCVFHCFGCGAKGDLIEFERRVSGCSLTTAKKRIEKLANRGGGSELRERRIVARYVYKDNDGDPLFEKVRFKPKSFAFRHLSETGEWNWGLGDVQRLLYHLPEVRASDVVFVTEGEKDAESVTSLGFVATTNPGGAGKWLEEHSKALKGKKVIVLQDDDEPGRKHGRAVAESVTKYATEVRLLPPFENAKDVTAWLENGGNKKRLLEIVKDTELFRASEGKGSDSDPETTVQTGDWRDECLRGELLVAMHESLYCDYLIFPSAGLPLVLALWGIGTYVFDAFDTYPYLIISSPAKRCAKTRLAKLLGKILSSRIPERQHQRSGAFSQDREGSTYADSRRSRNSQYQEFRASSVLTFDLASRL